MARFWKTLSANIDSHWQIWQQTATKGTLWDSEKSGIGPFTGDGNIGMTEYQEKSIKDVTENPIDKEKNA